MPRRNEFSAEEDQLLFEISAQIPQECKFVFKKMHQKFTQAQRERKMVGEPKSLKAIYLRYNLLFPPIKSQWNYQLDQEMLNLAAKQAKWKNIAAKEPFKSRNIKQNELKQKFKTDMLRKFRILISRSQGDDKIPEPSYIVFRQIMSEDNLVNMLKEGQICEKQFIILKKSIPFFRTSTYNQGQKSRSTRSQQALTQIIHNLDPDIQIQSLLRIISKVSFSSSTLKPEEISKQKKKTRKTKNNCFSRKSSSSAKSIQGMKNDDEFEELQAGSEDQIYEESIFEEAESKVQQQSGCVSDKTMEKNSQINLNFNTEEVKKSEMERLADY